MLLQTEKYLMFDNELHYLIYLSELKQSSILKLC